MAGFLIAAAHKSSGKTIISTGLSAALASDVNLQTFKKGPDYIDPMWLSLASKKSCYNLDFNIHNENELKSFFDEKSTFSDLSLVEANKGLYDGVDLQGKDSNAALAKLLNLPVILVIDTNGMTRGIAPLLLGYCAFDKDINIAGVILNKVGGARHEAKLSAAIKNYTDLKMVGSVWRNEKLNIGERHLGLTTPAETGKIDEIIDGFSNIIKQSVDLNFLKSFAKPSKIIEKKIQIKTNKKIRIGILKDQAFGFYYPDDLESFEKYGADLIEINSLKDKTLPKIDGLFIGGGFPEIMAKQLEANFNLRDEIKIAIENGLPTYAECGGLLYLCKSLEWQEKNYEMVGVVDAKVKMNKKPQGRGYVSLKPNENHIWAGWKNEINAHEFHYSSIENLGKNTDFAYEIKKGFGIDGQNDGIVIHNLIAGFCHLRNNPQNIWVKHFVEFVKSKTS